VPSSPIERELVGRDSELAVVDGWARLLTEEPGALVIHGEAGIGKTTIWNSAVAAARNAGCHVLVSRPVDAEIPFGYAGLGDLLLNDADAVLGQLAPTLARSLSGALLLGDGEEITDPLAVARGALGALRALAVGHTVVVAIDDVQWLDPSSSRSLAFALRRLGPVPVALLVSRRDKDGDPLGIRDAFGDRAIDMALGPLSMGAIGRILREQVSETMPRREVVRIHDLAGGNPYFALELARAGGGGRLPANLRDLIGRRLSEVDAEAIPAIELASVSGPASIGAFPNERALDRAVALGLLETHGHIVRFSHPLIAAAAYDNLGPGRRRELHRQCARSANSIESRARHLALATDGPDAATASLLDEASRAAASRGAPEAAAELAVHARRLTPPDDVEAYARRTMDEAEYMLLAADEHAVGELTGEVLATSVAGVVRARALLRRALVEVDAEEAVSLLEAAVAEEHDDAGLRARTLAALAWDRGIGLGDASTAVDEAIRAIRMAEHLDESTLAYCLTSAGFVLALAADPRAEGFLEQAVQIRRRTPGAARLSFATLAQQYVWRGKWLEAEALLAEERSHAPDGDEYVQLRVDLIAAENAIRRGHWDEAVGLLDTIIAADGGYTRIVALTQRALLRAMRGDRAALADASAVAVSSFAADRVVAAAMSHARALLDRTATGSFAPAMLAKFPSMGEKAGPFSGAAWWAIPYAVELLVSRDQRDTAAELTGRLKQRAAQLDPWGSAGVALCDGLLALGSGDTTTALSRIDEARRGFEQIGASWEVARCLLASGRALRRLGRRKESSSALDAAIVLFSAMSAVPSEREAADELRRARPRPRHDDTLTEAERNVAALVASGRTNKDVAAELFTTVATVEAHLTRVYSKLGIRSRSELAHRAPELIPTVSR
jgi:DNA-binding CsgD family transcriptional regulator/tetratricopeptide (TPR) repeat protein